MIDRGLRPVGGTTFDPSAARRQRIDDLSVRPRPDLRPLKDSPPEAELAEEYLRDRRLYARETRLEVLRALLKLGPQIRQPLAQRPTGAK